MWCSQQRPVPGVDGNLRKRAQLAVKRGDLADHDDGGRPCSRRSARSAMVPKVPGTTS